MHPIAKHAQPSAFHAAALTCVDVFLSRELPEISTDGKPPRQHHRCAISSQAACRSWLLRTRGRFPASAASRGRGQPPTVMLPPQSPFRTATAFLGKSGKRHRWCEAVPRRGTRWRRKRGLPAPRYLLVPRTTGTFPAALRDPWRPCEASPDSEAFPSGYQAPMPGGRLAPPPRFPPPRGKAAARAKFQRRPARRIPHYRALSRAKTRKGASVRGIPEAGQPWPRTTPRHSAKPRENSR